MSSCAKNIAPNESKGIVPLVSVIMPAYNAEKFIREAIFSVLGQTYPSIELIIVDDGSSDTTPQILEEFSGTINLIQQPNLGPAAARNRGVKEAKGELLAFIDADDVWHLEKISVQVEYLRNNPNIGICFGKKFEWLPNTQGDYPERPHFNLNINSSKIVLEDSGWIYPRVLFSSIIHIVSALIKRNIWDGLEGMDEKLRCGEDYDFFIRASLVTEVAALDQYLSWYRKHPNSITYRARPEVDEANVVLSAIRRFGVTGRDGARVDEKKLNSRISKIYFDHGYMNYWRGDPCVALTSFKTALSYRKTRLGKLIVYIALSYVKCKR